MHDLMERAMQSESSKVTLRLRGGKSDDNESINVDRIDGVAGESGSSNSDAPGIYLTEEQVTCASEGGSEVQVAENENDLSRDSQLQIVLYHPRGNDAGKGDNMPDPTAYQTPPSRRRTYSDHVPRVLPSIGAFTVQCANCFKWRLIPTKEKYEEIREHIMERPFVCEAAREWRPTISCDDPTDITQDGSRLWAIDKPSIAQTPPGWQRLLRIRGEGGTKFADVYYMSPTGKRLRSMVEIDRYLNEHPEYQEDGITLSRFSFQVPRPLAGNYVRRRPPCAAPANHASDHGHPGPNEPQEVLPISWVSPDIAMSGHISGTDSSTNYIETPPRMPEPRAPVGPKTSRAKRQRTSL